MSSSDSGSNKFTLQPEVESLLPLKCFLPAFISTHESFLIFFSSPLPSCGRGGWVRNSHGCLVLGQCQTTKVFWGRNICNWRIPVLLWLTHSWVSINFHEILYLHKSTWRSHKYWNFRCGLNIISKLFCPAKDALASCLPDVHLSSFLCWSWVLLLGHRCSLTADCFWFQRSTASVLSRKDQPSRPFS